MRSRRARAIAAAFGAVAVLSACAADVSVTARKADEIRTPVVTTSPTDPPETSDPQDPDDTVPVNEPIGEPDPTAIDFGANKPPRDYDDFLLAVMTDLEQWWAVEYPAVYGSPFEPMQGEVYAAHPERPDDIPGCGTERTTYQDVHEYVAFYCADGDFIVYDDGDRGLLTELAREYGAATIGTVFAHEFGHVVQKRFGAIDQGLPTITTEQQADCFAGAWTARVANGESDLVAFTENDVRSGLVAMTKVSDPVGIGQFVPGGHGSAFDRVGAFQVGYTEGAARCTELIDDPLPLMPNEFLSLEEQNSGGDAEFGYGDNQLLSFIPTDLNAYWADELDADIPALDALSLVVVESGNEVVCDDPRGDLEHGAVLCPSTGEVFFNEPGAFELYENLGDFSVGYVLGSVWSEAVQDALGSELTGEERALLSDCLTGGWVKTVIPVTDADGLYGLPEPRLAGREVSASAGDLDEAIQTVLLVADASSTDDVAGSAFEKIAAFRAGVLGGTESCLAQL